ncbi:MAG: hypothetical protein AOA65_2094 [Candidatus Bathyarchaeota archaeon BA1]|nr:MAG: hypothetical protein AOA65_2094 [Candidatus Bathyarchaeota archaeon BA1]
MPVSTVSKKGLTTIPSEVRGALKIKKGDMLEWKIVKAHNEFILQVRLIPNPYDFLKGRRKDPELTYEKIEDLADKLIFGELGEERHASH